MKLIVIHKNPRLNPGKYVGTEWYLVDGVFLKGPEPIMVSDDLLDVRDEVPLHMLRVERSIYDDPTMCELWL